MKVNKEIRTGIYVIVTLDAQKRGVKFTEGEVLEIDLGFAKVKTPNGIKQLNLMDIEYDDTGFSRRL